MSRTYHHKDQKHRHNGHDLWSRRNSGHLTYCAYNKLLTRRKERHTAKHNTQQEAKDDNA